MRERAAKEARFFRASIWGRITTHFESHEPHSRKREARNGQIISRFSAPKMMSLIDALVKPAFCSSLDGMLKTTMPSVIPAATKRAGVTILFILLTSFLRV